MERKQVNKVVIDSNFILLPFQYKINYFEEITYLLEGSTNFMIYQQSLDELNAKKARNEEKQKFQLQYEAGLRYLEKMQSSYDLQIVNERKNLDETTDEFLIRKLKELNNASFRVFLASNDKNLRREARKIKVNLIFLRSKKFLQVELS